MDGAGRGGAGGGTCVPADASRLGITGGLPRFNGFAAFMISLSI
jgi:hypothetical protein